MKKDKELFFFFGISDAAAFKSHLRTDIHPLITTTTQILSVSTQPLTAVNIAFSGSGLTALGVDPVPLNQDVFVTGQFEDATVLGDPGTDNWIPGFKGTQVHGMFILASDTIDNINDELENIVNILGDSITEIYRLQGAARPGAEAGHERTSCIFFHTIRIVSSVFFDGLDFGFMDGISQPAINGFTTSPLPGQLPMDAGHFLLLEQSDGLTRPAWSKDGSFLAFRQLQQLVPEFNQFLVDKSLNVPGLTPDLLGARMVGRWKSVSRLLSRRTSTHYPLHVQGAPIDLSPTADNASLAADNTLNNDFTFTHPGFDIASDQTHCPFSAHIRKVNPREDFGSDQDNVNHIIRSSIPYGPEGRLVQKYQVLSTNDPTSSDGC